MTCSCDIFRAPEIRATCPACANMARLEWEGRELADMIDAGTVSAEVRASIMGATTAADVAPGKGVRPWSVEARRVVDGVGF